jgi:ATP-dependent helicase/nuclease subunit A
VGEAIRKRDVVRGGSITAAASTVAVAVLCETLGISSDDTLERVESEMIEGPLLPFSRWAAAAQTLMQGSKSDQEQGARLIDALATSAPNGSASIYSSFSPTNSKPASAWSPRQSRKVIPSLPIACNGKASDCWHWWSAVRLSPAEIVRPRSSPSPMQ